MAKYSLNPVLDNNLYVCDVEAREFEGRLYLYGTYGNDSSIFHVYSTDDMKNWIDHGVVFSVSDVKWIKANSLWAPDCVFVNGTYYLYYSIPSGEMGVAKSEKPFGPFVDLGKINVEGIDPSVLIDDGQVYLFWGQMNGVRAAKLKDNMMEIDESSITQPLTVEEHGMHEGSSVRKINGKYYYVYTDTHRRGKATCQGYSVSNEPLTVYKYKNVIVDCFSCDPESWNNHGCIQQYKGEWYIFYHRATGAVYGWNNPRQLCIEKIKFDKDGNIEEVLPTSSGINDYVCATETLQGANACALSGGANIAEEKESLHFLSVKNINPHSSITFRYLKFTGENIVNLRLKGQGVCRIDIYIDGKYHDFITVNADMFFKSFEKEILSIDGVHEVELKFYGLFKDLTFDEFKFNKI